jgi:hypothetical protein
MVLGAIWASSWIRFATQWFVARLLPPEGLRGEPALFFYWADFGLALGCVLLAGIVIGRVIETARPAAWALVVGLSVWLYWYGPRLLVKDKPVSPAIGSFLTWCVAGALLAGLGVIKGRRSRGRLSGPAETRAVIDAP